MSIVRGLADIFFGPTAGQQVEALRAKLGIERRRGDGKPLAGQQERRKDTQRTAAKEGEGK